MDRAAIVCRLPGAHFRDIGIVIPLRSGTDGRRNGKISFCRSDGKCTRMRSPIFAPHSGCRTHCLPAFCRVGLGLPTFWAAFLLRAILFTRNFSFPGRPFIEEIGFLPPFLLLRTGDVDFFMCIGVLPGVEHHRREGHRRRGEILYLFEVEMELAEYFRRQRAHVMFGAARV